MAPPPKLPNVQKEAIRLLNQGFYFETHHALQRMPLRGIASASVQGVTRRGRRHESHDTYDDEVEAGAYASEGETIDGTPLRVFVSLRGLPPFPNEWVVVVTAIAL